MLTVSCYDTKSYDREYFERAEGSKKLRFRFHDFRLSCETAATAEGSQAVCVFVNDQLDAECLQKLARIGIKLIAMRCAGFNNIDLPAAKSFGIGVVRVAAYSPYAVAEHTITLLMSLNRRIHKAYNRVREHNFSLTGLVGFDLHGKTVGIVGTGRIGQITAQIVRGFDAKVIAYDPIPKPEWAAMYGVEYANFPQLLAESDVVSLHLPLTPQTRFLLNAQALEKMKRGAILLNTSRGKLIDTSAVIDALKSGQLAGVGLDVYEEEEGLFFEDLSGEVLQDDELSRLLTFPNVLVTAHQAFLTHEALSEIARVTTTNLLRYSEQQPLLDGSVLVESGN